MRKILLSGVALAALGTGTAFADGDVKANIKLEKDINIFEAILVEKNVIAIGDVDLDADKFAESTALANQSVYGNTACTNCAEKADTIIASANANTGEISINQAGGNFNNQGTLISAAVDVSTDPPAPPPPPDVPASTGGFAEAQAAADQRNGVSEFDVDFELADDGAIADDGTTTISGDGNLINSVNIVFRDAIIDTSFNGNTGLVHGNQATGNANNQANVLSLAFSLAEGGVALSEADLGQLSVANFIGEASTGADDETGIGDAPADTLGINKLASISGSINNNIGIVGINQSVGNAGNQANVVSVAAVGADLPTF